MIDQPSEQSTKYLVSLRPDGWRVEAGDHGLGVFSSSVEAVDVACRLARCDAEDGRLAMVTAETSPQEFHCFIPPPGHAPTTSAPAFRPYLRLVTGQRS